MPFLAPIGGAIAGLAGTGIPTALATTAISSGLQYAGNRNANKAIKNATSPEAYQAQLDASVDSYIKNTPRLLAADQANQPRAIDTQLAGNYQSLFGGQDQPGLIEQGWKSQEMIDRGNIASGTRQLEGDYEKVANFGPGFFEQLRRLNPALYQSMDDQTKDSPMMDHLKGRVTGDMQTIDGIDSRFGQERDVLQGLRATAESDVQRQGRLNPEQLRNVQQYSRQGDEARGMLRSGQSIGNEILNSDSARRAMLAFADQRLAGISGLQGQSEQRHLNFRNSLIGNAASLDQTAFGQGQTRISNRMATMFDPLVSVLGRPSINQSNSGILNQQSQYAQLNAQRPNAANDVYGMANGLFRTGADAGIQMGNNSAEANSGIASGIGSLLQSGAFDKIFSGRTPPISNGIAAF